MSRSILSSTKINDRGAAMEPETALHDHDGDEEVLSQHIINIQEGATSPLEPYGMDLKRKPSEVAK